MNTKATATPTAGTTKTVVLVKEHKDAGVVLLPGAELTLIPALADWLVEVGVAEFK